MLIFYISLLHLSGICECQQGQMSCELSLDLAAQLAVLQHVAWFLTTQSWCIISYFLQLIVMHYFSYHLLFSFLLFAVCPTSPSPSLLEISGIAATRAGPHQPVHLQPASVYGWAGAGEYAEASGSRHLHKDTEGCQRGQQRSRLCQVNNVNEASVKYASFQSLQMVCQALKARSFL